MNIFPRRMKPTTKRNLCIGSVLTVLLLGGALGMYFGVIRKSKDPKGPEVDSKGEQILKDDKKAAVVKDSSDDKKEPPVEDSLLKALEKPEYAGILPFISIIFDHLNKPKLSEADRKRLEKLEREVLSKPLLERAQQFYDAVQSGNVKLLKDVYDVDNLERDVHHLHLQEFRKTVRNIIDASKGDEALTTDIFQKNYDGFLLTSKLALIHKPTASACIFRDFEEYKSTLLRTIGDEFPPPKHNDPSISEEERNLLKAEHEKLKEKITQVFCEYAPNKCEILKNNLKNH